MRSDIVKDRQVKAASPVNALDAYVNGVLTVGTVVLSASAIDAIRAPHPLGWLSLAAVALITGSFRLTFASVSGGTAASAWFGVGGRMQTVAVDWERATAGKQQRPITESATG